MSSSRGTTTNVINGTNTSSSTGSNGGTTSTDSSNGSDGSSNVTSTTDSSVKKVTPKSNKGKAFLPSTGEQVSMLLVALGVAGILTAILLNRKKSGKE
ncbi:TPA: LPXTG cell wall anchor domain-containing protein [Streptococcus suis]|nr:LPXTG cell wall anchor domain-containing protein [Streptococcus suis]